MIFVTTLLMILSAFGLCAALAYVLEGLAAVCFHPKSAISATKADDAAA